MSPASLLLKAYYERLYERMVDGRAQLLLRIDEMLSAEIERRRFPDMDEEKRTAYRDACEAFFDERLETYNPIGVQYTFGHVPSQLAAELEFQLDWYDSKGEFADLVAAARSLAGPDMADETIRHLAAELIGLVGAFPDRSIISGYRVAPALQKLPDYILACAIEEVICATGSSS